MIVNLFLVSGNFSLHWQVEDCYRNESAIGFLLHMFYYNSAIYSTVSNVHELENLRMIFIVLASAAGRDFATAYANYCGAGPPLPQIPSKQARPHHTNLVSGFFNVPCLTKLTN